eukprot:scaffold126469_cov90-Phaeocystis_antarctica.AAC.7
MRFAPRWLRSASSSRRIRKRKALALSHSKPSAANGSLSASKLAQLSGRGAASSASKSAALRGDGAKGRSFFLDSWPAARLASMCSRLDANGMTATSLSSE